ncbi:uncharacterized protein MYCGRDRAFT_94358 [Zymoseptoria tritici IPO323]|uniref:Uncharacterized protein n=1 Tax=Zymoseptoria tritici (strain CBS 115943 / IPO323) TaxID=336722 RepID=F9XFA5_ZYMTI|nr:uncharacterized protein MYCGRDRAFT_94358 [Zymoseptoria tritici IPO323]EGP86196.1 hypothetical protein MYCGRDRAFT_94358 [Zymoseptoria tritici IPO323]
MGVICLHPSGDTTRCSDGHNYQMAQPDRRTSRSTKTLHRHAASAEPLPCYSSDSQHHRSGETLVDYPTPLFHALTQPMFLEAKELPTEGPAAQVLGLAGPVNSVTGRLTDGQADLGTTHQNKVSGPLCHKRAMANARAHIHDTVSPGTEEGFRKCHRLGTLKEGSGGATERNAKLLQGTIVMCCAGKYADACLPECVWSCSWNNHLTLLDRAIDDRLVSLKACST